MTPKMTSNLLVLVAMTLVIFKEEGHSSDIQYILHDKCEKNFKANEECKKNGGDMARLETHEQINALTEQLPNLWSNKKYWITNDSCNAHDRCRCCVFTLISGQWKPSPRNCSESLWYICQKDGPETTHTTTSQTSTATTTILSSTTRATTTTTSTTTTEGSKATDSSDKKPTSKPTAKKTDKSTDKSPGSKPTSKPTAGKPDKSTNKSPGSNPTNKPNGGKPDKSTGESPGNKPIVNPGNKPTSLGGANKPQGTGTQKTKMDKKIDELVKKMKEMSVEDVNSIEEVTSMTSELVKEMKNNKEEKGNVLKASQAIEDFGIKYARYHFNASNSTTGTIKESEGLIFEVMKVMGKMNITFPHKTNESSEYSGNTTISVPGVLFDGQDHYVVNTLLRDVSENIPKSNGGQKEIISPVISSTLDPKPDPVLKENVTITLTHYKKPKDFKPSCVFWNVNLNLNDMGGEWSTRGCTVVYSDDNSTVCSCNHLTSFALLMQVDDTPTSDYQHYMALSYITYIGCAFSLLGEILTVLAYFLFMNMKQEQCQIRVNLAISLAVAQIFFLSGITATSNLGVCTFVGVMLHYFYLVAFGWMMLEGVYLFLMVVKVFNTVIKMKLYYIFAWGFPLIAVCIALAVAFSSEEGIQSYTHENFCWVSFANGLIRIFVIPVILISLLNIIILILVVLEMTRLNQAKSDGMDSFRRGVKACLVLFPLLGLTWLFGLLSVTNAGIVFQYIFTILNSFQGFFIFVLHCLRSAELRSSCKRKLQRMELLQSSNFSSSKSATSESYTSGSNKSPSNVFASTGSLQGAHNPRHNRISPNNMEMDNHSVRTCMTPIDS